MQEAHHVDTMATRVDDIRHPFEDRINEADLPAPSAHADHNDSGEACKSAHNVAVAWPATPEGGMAEIKYHILGLGVDFDFSGWSCRVRPAMHAYGENLGAYGPVSS